MTSQLERKLKEIHSNSNCKEFILADARDADLCWGVPSPGLIGNGSSSRFRTMPEFLEQIRDVVKQGVVDILLASASTLSVLAHREKLFAESNVTPAMRANDTSDVWCPRGGKYRESPSLPFASSYIEEAQYGSVLQPAGAQPVVNLGLYSITFNNRPEIDREALIAFKEFRAEARRKNFQYFLEVFAPNVESGIAPEEIPCFVNDQICRTLAGVSMDDRPIFLKVPYFGPPALEELVAYDPSTIVGIMGGSSGTTLDAFHLLAEAQRYGARAALYGRKIKDSEDPLAFIAIMRRIVDGELKPAEAVRAYHSDLQRKKIVPKRPLEDDLESALSEMHYGR
jgi:hypothetical protein